MRNFNTEFYIQTDQDRVRVCKESFLSVLSIGRSKVEFAAKTFLLPSNEVKENRGGKIEVLTALKEKIIDHVKTFRIREALWSH